MFAAKSLASRDGPSNSCVAWRLCYASGMIKTSLFAAASVAALAFASPATARPMTATDMHMMHRVGAPELSPDGKWAVFTISDSDLAANMRNNTLYLL